MKKRLLAALLAVMIAMSFVGCNNDKDPDPDPDPAPTKYTVTFDSDGGSAVDAQSLEKDKKVTEPTAPTKARFTFAGWYWDYEDEFGATYTELWDFDKAIEGNLTLKAHWTQSQFLVTFVTNVEGVNVEEQVIDPNGKVTKPADIEKEGYTFVGWYTGTAYAQKYDFEAEVTQDRALYARWFENKTIDGNLIDWSNEEKANYIAVRGAANETRGGTLYAKQVRDHGLFLAGYFDHNTNPTGGTAKDWWRRPNVEFHVNGSGSSLHVNRDDDTNVPDKSAKLVTEARTEAGNEAFPNNFRSSFEIFIAYDKIPGLINDGAQRIGFCFMASHAANNVAAAGSVAESVALGGRGGDALWCREGLGPFDKSSGYYVFEDITARGIYDNAQCDPVVNTVMFNTNGGSEVGPQEAELGAKITEPTAPTRAGYTLEGWYKSSNFTISEPSSANVTTGNTSGNYTQAKWDFTKDTVSEGYNLYAKWVPATENDYTVKFNVNGSAAVIDNITEATIGDLVAKPADITKEGYVFIDWYESATFEGTPWNFASSRIPYRENKEFTLNALWLLKENKTVTFNTDGGTAIENITVMAGEVAERPAYPTKAGNVFAGWFKDAAKTQEWNFKTDKVLGNITIYAKWEASALTAVTGEIMGIRDERGNGAGFDIAAWIVTNGGANNDQTGVQIRYAIYHNNDVKTNAGEWHQNTNAELWIANASYFYTLGTQASNLNNGTGSHATVAGSTVPGVSSKWVTTVNLFIPNAVAIDGNLRMQFATKSDGGTEKLKIKGFTSTGGLDAWWMVSTNTVRAFRGEGNTFGGLGNSASTRFFVYSDGMRLTAK